MILTDHAALQSLRRTQIGQQLAEPIGQQARLQTFIEQFSFTIRHRNADALSRRPDTDTDDEVEENEKEVTTETVRRVKASTVRSSEESVTTAGKETMAEFQQADPDIEPILRLRLRQVEQPRLHELLPESEATKILWGQWYNLIVQDNVLYCKVTRSYGRPPTIQFNGRPPTIRLIIPVVKRTEFITQCHEGITGGHRSS